MNANIPIFSIDETSFSEAVQIDRRGLLCGLAAMPAAAAVLAPSAMAASAASAMAISDPILAAIEAHIFAVVKYEKTFDAGDPPEGDESGEADRAAWAMLEIEPTSIEGVSALLLYFAQSSGTNEQFFPEVFDGEVNFPAALARHAAKALSRILEGVQ